MGRFLRFANRDRSRRWPRTSIISLAMVAALSLFRCSVGIAKSDKNAEAARLFEAARQRVNFRAPGSPPVRIVQNFTIWTRERGMTQGTDTLIWAYADKWQETLRFPDFLQISVGGRGVTWRLINQPAPTREAFDASALVRFEGAMDHLRDVKVAEIRETQAGQTHEKCVSINAKEEPRQTYCFDSNSGDLLSSTRKSGTDEWRIEWSDYINLGGHWLPRHTRNYEDGALVDQSAISEATILSSVAPTTFVPPDGSERLDTCENPVYPVPISKPDPVYTPGARSRKVNGTVTLYVKVDSLGKVVVVSVLDSLDQGLDENAMVTIKSDWN